MPFTGRGLENTAETEYLLDPFVTRKGALMYKVDIYHSPMSNVQFWRSPGPVPVGGLPVDMHDALSLVSQAALLGAWIHINFWFPVERVQEYKRCANDWEC